MHALILGLIMMVSWSVRCGAVTTAAAHERDVVFRHGDTALAGTLFVPAGSGPFPATVLMPGSGNQSRAPLVVVARALADAGLLTLIYDKQGSGNSQGSWLRESLDDLAGDGLAALQFLRALPEADARRIGAWGISQSGWVLPRMAARDRQLAFLICVSGGGASPREVEYVGYRNALRHAGFGEPEWQAAKPLIDRYMQYLADGKDRDGLLAALDAAAAQRWSGAVDLRRVLPDAATRDKWSWVPTLDPLPEIRALHMPVLVLVGGSDPFAPVDVAVQRWQDGLSSGDPHDLVISHPTAGHGIRINGHDMHAAPVFAPGYLHEQIDWLREIDVLR